VGELEYPLPGEFGIGADVDYVIGSDELPEIQFGEVDFNADRFMTDLMNDHVPRGSHGEQEQPGEWNEGEVAGAPAEPQQVDTQGAPSAEPVRGRQQPEEGEAPRPELQERWLGGLRALGELSERSQTDPFDQREIDAALARIRTRYRFTELRERRVGEDWQVHAEMNPSSNITVEGVEQEQDVREANINVGDEIQVSRKGGWDLARITEIISTTHIRYEGRDRWGRISGLLQFSGLGRTWRRYVPERGYKTGEDWEAIKDLGIWANLEDARQALNYRYHAKFRTPPSKQWHHIHERSAGGPNSVRNLAITDSGNNQDFNVWFGQSQEGTGGQSLRDWLRGQPAGSHREWGLRAIRLHGLSIRSMDLGRGPFQEIV
jgi:hypothetical protein